VLAVIRAPNPLFSRCFSLFFFPQLQPLVLIDSKNLRVFTFFFYLSSILKPPFLELSVSLPCLLFAFPLSLPASLNMFAVILCAFSFPALDFSGPPNGITREFYSHSVTHAPPFNAPWFWFFPARIFFGFRCLFPVCLCPRADSVFSEADFPGLPRFPPLDHVPSPSSLLEDGVALVAPFLPLLRQLFLACFLFRSFSCF